MYESAHDIESLWTAFKDDILAAANQHISSTSSTPRHHLPWLNHHLKKLLKKKKTLIQRGNKNTKLDQLQLIQKACKQAFRKAEWKHLRNTIEDGLSNNNPKPFRRYINVKQKRYNSGVAPLKCKGSLSCDAKSKAQIPILWTNSAQLLQQYKTNNDTDPLNKLPQYNQISDLHIDEDGVASLLKFVKNINSSKAPGPDQIPNHNYTYFF